METSKLRKFAANARKALMEQVGTRLKSVLAEGSLARRESAGAVAELEKRIKDLGKSQVIETAAYTWFNRFCALRYMDVNRYTRIGVLSPAEGQFQPEILAEAKMGHVDDEMVPEKLRQKVLRILDESDPSPDPQGEAYRLLLVAVCNYYHSLMPFMFEKIADYTELLLPDDLLSGTSIPAYTREALIPANCSPDHTEESVEVIGWLYQFYISEKKDDVFAALKKGKKITPKNIPAATQLFTPHWIVRYLVENSLGRLWMLNHPDSQLAEQMDYYIRPDVPETDFLRIAKPEEIKICDPACGSGHMLTYAFDLLYAIYEEQGYQATDIPRLILTHNLYGIEIDQRAGALAAFALTMKAREKYRRFLTGGKVVQPNICVLENIQIAPEDLSAYLDKVGRDLFHDGLQGVVNQWEEADNFGSLIRPLVTDVSEVLELLRKRQMGEDLFLAGVHQKVLKALRQAYYLSPKYHVVVANPPYMGSRNMAARLKEYLQDRYKDVKSDLFSSFFVRSTELTVKDGFLGFMSPFVWMFIGSYEDLRLFFIKDKTLTSLVQLEYSGFEGATVPICTFTLKNTAPGEQTANFIRLSDFRGSDKQAPKTLEAIRNPNCGWHFQVTPKLFLQIPGAPISYWISPEVRRVFARSQPLEEVANIRQGLATCNNDLFLRLWYEVSNTQIGFGLTDSDAANESGLKWFPYNKGGGYRQWYGNNEYVVNWESRGRDIHQYSNLPMDYSGAPVRAKQFYFHEGITYGLISSFGFSARRVYGGFVFDVGGSMIFPRISTDALQGFLSSNLVKTLIGVLNPTLNYQVGDVQRLPILVDAFRADDPLTNELIEISKADWDSFETSWDFTSTPLLSASTQTISGAYESIRESWRNRTTDMRDLETKNNQRFIQAYEVSNSLSPDVEIDSVTLLRNPTYRYEVDDSSEASLEALLLADTMREFISYAVGCMLGRYSLDKPGLILANQGETADDYRQQIPEPTFAPDEDNVIPLLDGDWFTDDISERFKEFLKVTFGTEHYEENLTFLENGLYPDNLTGKKRRTIRDYFLKEFYNHHIKLYKKRPIYWLFSSPKGTFNALIYMHRYRPDTVSVVLGYLRDFRDKLTHHTEHLQSIADRGDGSKTEKTKALKQITEFKKQLKELDDYERKTLFPLAQKQLDIDLDDGVKFNYTQFGAALKKIPGLDKKEA